MDKTTRLYCQPGDHYWERKAQRGRPPFACPEHAPAKPQARKMGGLKEKSEEASSKTLSEEHKAKLAAGRQEAALKRAREEEEAARIRLSEDLERQKGRVETAQKENDETYEALVAAGGASKASDAKFNKWLLANDRLLAQITALRSLENRQQAA